MHNSVVPPRRISLQAQPQFSLDESLKMIATRIQQTKDEIEKLQEKMDQFQPNKANTTTQKQYFQERRKFIFTNIQMLQRHLGKLIQNQAILKGDGITETDLKSMVQVLEQLSQEGIEIMKSCLGTQEYYYRFQQSKS